LSIAREEGKEKAKYISRAYCILTCQEVRETFADHQQINPNVNGERAASEVAEVPQA
jgi:hypothetical protein